MKEVITQLENIDLGKELLVTMQSVSEYNIFESEEILVPDDLFENEDLKNSTQLFYLGPAANLQNFCLLMKHVNCVK